MRWDATVAYARGVREIRCAAGTHPTANTQASNPNGW